MSFRALKPSSDASELITKILMAALAAILIVSALITVFPFLWSALLSTRDRTEIFGSGISLMMGDSLAINYEKLLEIMPFWQAMFNSIYVAFLGTTISLLFVVWADMPSLYLSLKAKIYCLGCWLVR